MTVQLTVTAVYTCDRCGDVGEPKIGVTNKHHVSISRPGDDFTEEYDFCPKCFALVEAAIPQLKKEPK
jgi:hypothetical protein